MTKTLRELAREALLDSLPRQVTILRFTVSTTFGFGLDVQATKDGFRDFVAAVEALGLDPRVNRRVRVSQDPSEPVEYVYEVYVDIPDNWTR